MFLFRAKVSPWSLEPRRVAVATAGHSQLRRVTKFCNGRAVCFKLTNWIPGPCRFSLLHLLTAHGSPSDEMELGRGSDWVNRTVSSPLDFTPELSLLLEQVCLLLGCEWRPYAPTAAGSFLRALFVKVKSCRRKALFSRPAFPPSSLV